MDNEVSKAIVDRFFKALDHLKEQGIIHGHVNFAERHGINRRNMYKQKMEPERDILKPVWLTYLVIDYNVSPEWLLTGKGKILKRKRTRKNNPAQSAKV
ncbi:MAG: hypothetical protein NC324_07280 [Bacteroides sp.]|nr:hypothetical protein [Bacteroides sp.]